MCSYNKITFYLQHLQYRFHLLCLGLSKFQNKISFTSSNDHSVRRCLRVSKYTRLNTGDHVVGYNCCLTKVISVDLLRSPDLGLALPQSRNSRSNISSRLFTDTVSICKWNSKFVWRHFSIGLYYIETH